MQTAQIPTAEVNAPSTDRSQPASVPVPEAVAEVRPVLRSAASEPELNEFSYRPVPVIAVVGLMLALLSSAAVFIWLVLPLCLVAFVISVLGFWVIRRSRGGYGGTGVAISGMFLAFVFFTGGIGFQVYAYQTEVPPGYQRVSFSQDISDKGMRYEDGKVSAPPEVAELDGKKVFLKGYIYQTGQLENLGAFLFVKDNADCCFGGKPKLWDRLGVVMQEGKTINYRAGKVAVAGTFRLNPKFQGDNELEPIYIIEGDHFSGRVSDF
ncbi:hypothetical protein [Planctomicrobium piriforme]|uniref:DUF4190 domain-containing protein n=1 Tax=Planctomicrobium piriforme TaxID=1576369 RepID=A0A1I3EP86_9PLAN|nr:hypothetical protein [Planctomicrobium piriforme]SFI00501.1 hypothetical protein SAMN05421753_104303 [Planctomicrobium piriforme]